MFNNNDACLWYINTDFNNGCGDKNLGLSGSKFLHCRVTFGSFHFAMSQSNADTGQSMTKVGKTIFGGGNVQFI